MKGRAKRRVVKKASYFLLLAEIGFVANVHAK